MFFLAWTLERTYPSSIQIGLWMYFGMFAPLLDLYLIIIRSIEQAEAKQEKKTEEEEFNLFGFLFKTSVQLFLLGLFISVFGSMSTPEDFTPETIAKREAQEQQEALKRKQEQELAEKANAMKTQNGIAFKVLSKRYTTEAVLRQSGIPTDENSLVLVVNVLVLNDGNNPYNPNIKARLLDRNGATYAGGVYKNILEMVNSSQNILNPGMSKEEILFFKIPREQEYILELQDGSIFSTTVSLKL